MQDDKKEWLSALVDNQGEVDDLARVTVQDDSLDCWSRYHLIGDVMRGDTAKQIDLDLTASIEHAIDAESNVVDLAQQRSWRQRLSQHKLVTMGAKYSARIGQFSVAATVCMFTVFGVQDYQQQQQQSGSTLPVFQTSGPVSGTITPVSLDASLSPIATQPNVSAQQQRELLQQQQRVKALLHDHQQQLKRQSQKNQ